MRRTEYQIAMAALKGALKKQGITYRELARRLGLSESGVKKIFTARDGSFQRVAAICRDLGLSMGELLAGEEEGMQEISFTSNQQEMLLAHPSAWRLYWALVYERRPLEEAQRAAGLGKKETFSILRKLDQAQLLELLPGDRVRVPAVRQIRWVGDGPLVRKLYQEWAGRMVRERATPESAPGAHFLIRYYRASRRTLNELIAAIRDLETEFTRRAVQEMRTEAPDLVHVRWISAADDRSFLE